MANREYHRLYNTARWKALRVGQLSANPLCRMDLALGRVVPATVVDHVQPHRGDHALFFGGELQSLCKHCHDAHKQAQEHSADGLVRGAGVDGRPLDLAHPWHRAGHGGGVQMSTAPQHKTGECTTFATSHNSEGGA